MKFLIWFPLLIVPIAAVDGNEDASIAFQIDRMKMKLDQLDQVLDAMKQQNKEIISLKRQIDQQSMDILLLKDQVEELMSASKSSPKDQHKIIFGRDDSVLSTRTCQQARSSNPSLKSGMYWIDPDGLGVGDEPIYVYCNMTSGVTSVGHDSLNPIEVSHCLDPGCYSRNIVYNSTLRQLKALVELSSSCRQSIQYDCLGAPFEQNGKVYAWWSDRNSEPQYYWSGDHNATDHICQCGMDGNCVDEALPCNCDTAASSELSDRGILTNKSRLPVTSLHFGGTLASSSSGVHTLGPLECSGSVGSKGMPESCADLWKNGHYLSGIYSIKGSQQIETVFCDMALLPSDNGIQQWLGYADVKSSPVHFYVQKNKTFSVGSSTATIPFEIERLNVGGAMDLKSGVFTAPAAGEYYFSFSTLEDRINANCLIYLQHNNVTVGTALANSPHIETISLVSALHLEKSDQISLVLGINSSIYDDTNHYTHFVGWVINEELFE